MVPIVGVGLFFQEKRNGKAQSPRPHFCNEMGLLFNTRLHCTEQVFSLLSDNVSQGTFHVENCRGGCLCRDCSFHLALPDTKEAVCTFLPTYKWLLIMKRFRYPHSRESGFTLHVSLQTDECAFCHRRKKIEEVQYQQLHSSRFGCYAKTG